MSFTALVIGYGSIGERHADILNSMDAVDNVSVLSCQSDLPYMTIKKLEEIPELDPNYIVIASNTVLHHKQLAFLVNNLHEKKILVEKPLFDSFQNLSINDNEVFVGYNLRFHPIIIKIKQEIKNKELWNIQLNCGSFLPNWRPARDYRETSSAKKLTGGGVLLDLSHELDYILWLLGTVDIKYVLNEKVSNLEIDTDDLLIISGKSGKANLQICLNYFARKPIRQILIDGNGISLQANLINNSASLYLNNEFQELSWPNLSTDDTYLDQHHAILNNDFSMICNYKEGLKTMRLIDRVRTFNE
jgi:predicted dehydrogenase